MIRYLSAKAPFSFKGTVRSHGWVQLAPFYAEEPYDEVEYAYRLSTGRVVPLHLAAGGEGVAVAMPDDLSAAEQEEVASGVTWMMALEQDLAPFHAVVRGTPELAHVIERAEGRLLRSPTLWEDTVKTILTTNTTWSGTIRMVRALVEQYGEPVEGEPVRRAFPTAERLAGADPEALRTVTRLGYRAPYVRELAERVSSGDLDLESFKTAQMSTAALRKALMEIKGVGSYAAANLLLLLGRTDFIPVDSYAYKLVSREFYDGRPVSAREIEAAFARWGEWKGIAYWFWKWRDMG